MITLVIFLFLGGALFLVLLAIAYMEIDRKYRNIEIRNALREQQQRLQQRG